jgi:hypothetical protein
MSQFFFHLVSPAGYDVDDVGSEFPTLELAYLDAHAAASEMCVEIIRDHGDPMRYQFEIVDQKGRFLIELPFSEVIRPRFSKVGYGDIKPRIVAEIRRAQRLRDEISIELARIRATLARTNAAMARLSVN